MKRVRSRSANRAALSRFEALEPRAMLSATAHFALAPQDLLVNDPPTMTAENVIVQSNSGPQVIDHWATFHPGGGPDEAAQTVTPTIIAIEMSRPGLLLAGPQLSPDGTLRFTPAPGARGLVGFSVQLMDDGGTANGGDDTSGPFNFTIEIGSALQTFRVVDGNLVVETGDGDDLVSIVGIAPGQFSVLVNGQSDIATGVTGGIQIDTKAGADSVILQDTHMPRSIVIDTGDGADTVELGSVHGVSTAQDLVVRLGPGDDSLGASRTFVAGNLTIDAGAGGDRVVMAGGASPFFVGASSRGATSISGGDGNDVLILVYAFIVDRLTIDGGAGDDSIQMIGSAISGPVSMNGGDQGDAIALAANYLVSSVVLSGGAGNDGLVYTGNIGVAATTLDGGGGHDSIQVYNVLQQSLRVAADAGHDSADIRASLLEALFADLGEGDDRITVYGNLVHGAVELHGGLGLADRLLDLGNSFRGAYRKRTFEFFA